MPKATAKQHGLREATSLCRVCIAGCGTRLTIDANDRIVDIRPDPDNPNSKGYGCSKGMQAADAHHGAERLLRPLKRNADGSFSEIPLKQALDEIAEKLRPYAKGDDPDAIAVFAGNAGGMAAAARPMQSGFLAALGSRSWFTATTIDQPNKLLSAERLGSWAAGLHGIDGSDVALLFGTNPVLSHSCGGFLYADPARRLKQAKARGLKLIVIDPRVSETARQADLHVQTLPGQDLAIAGGLIRLILDEGWHDADFVSRFAAPEGLAALRAAVEPLTEAAVEHRAGLRAGQLRQIAEMFARDGRRGAAYTATGPSFSPYGSAAQHLINALNVVCGRYRRAGDPVAADPTRPPTPVYEEVRAPSRNFERFGPSRIRGARMLGGERLTATLPEEILTPGKGQVRCLFLAASNPMASIPDSRRVGEALKSLDLLVALSPHMTASARYAHYILPPRMQYERADLQLSIPGIPVYSDSWGQYTPAIIDPPAGSEVCDDWYPFWAVAGRLGLAINYNSQGELPIDSPPTTEDLIALRMAGSRVPLEELKTFPSGHIFDFDTRVLPGRPEADGRFAVMPPDVAEELAQFLEVPVTADKRRSQGQDFGYLLMTRRQRNIHCTTGVELASTLDRHPYNPVFLHPDDLAEAGIAAGTSIRITSDRSAILAIAEADKTMRRGCIAMAFGWGGDAVDDDEWDGKANINLLIACDRDTDPVTALPRMTAIPVNIEAASRSPDRSERQMQSA